MATYKINTSRTFTEKGTFYIQADNYDAAKKALSNEDITEITDAFGDWDIDMSQSKDAAIVKIEEVCSKDSVDVDPEMDFRNEEENLFKSVDNRQLKIPFY